MGRALHHGKSSMCVPVGMQRASIGQDRQHTRVVRSEAKRPHCIPATARVRTLGCLLCLRLCTVRCHQAPLRTRGLRTWPHSPAHLNILVQVLRAPRLCRDEPGAAAGRGRRGRRSAAVGWCRLLDQPVHLVRRQQPHLRRVRAARGRPLLHQRQAVLPGRVKDQHHCLARLRTGLQQRLGLSSTQVW